MKNKVFWIANDGMYNVNDKKMDMSCGYIPGNKIKKWFCKRLFERLTGIKMKKGEQKKFRLVEVK